MPPAAPQAKIEGALRRQQLGDILVLTLDHPPANALGLGLMAELEAALATLSADPGLRAALILGAGRGFSAGMDPSIFGTVDGAAALGRLCLRIETCAKPVTAAIHGTCLGAGLELALACHWRIATADAQLGLPEIHLGLVPGSGGSQRLPRLIGGKAALDLGLEGAPIPAAEALALGLVDEVATETFLDTARRFAASRPGPRRTSEGERAAEGLFGPGGALAQARQRLARHRLPAPLRLVACIEAAALLPFEAGLVLEATTLADLAATDEARGLRAAWTAERRAAQVPAAVLAVGQPRIETLGLWAPSEAAVTMLIRALASGLKVIVAAEDRAHLVRILNQVAAAQDAAMADGSLSDLARDADWARLSAVLDGAALDAADLILAGPEAPETVPALRRVRVGGLPPGAEGLALTLPEAPGGPAEIAQGPNADPALAALALALARRVGARPIFTGPGGPILARLRQALGRAIAAIETQGTPRAEIAASLAAFGAGTGTAARLPAMPRSGPEVLRACLAALAAEGARLVDEGAARRPLDVDAVALHAGLLPRWEGGPMAWADRQGLLVLRADLWQRTAQDPELYAVSPLIDRLIAAGRPLVSLNGRA